MGDPVRRTTRAIWKAIKSSVEKEKGELVNW